MFPMDIPFKAIVFDFDGLIVETEEPIFESYSAIFAEFGLELTLKVWANVIGGTGHRDVLFDYLELQLGRKVNREMIRERARNHHHNDTGKLPAREGVVDLIVEASEFGLQLGIASSSTFPWVKGHLDRLGLSKYFSVMCTREDVELSKPDPALYLLAVSKLDVPPDQVFAIEDSPNGVKAAQAAGIRCIAVPNPVTKSMDISHADILVNSLAEINLDEIFRLLRTAS